MPKHDDYAVGFGKPPKKHQFKAGQSGNPKGRPKGSRSPHTLFREIRDQKVKVKDGDGTRYVTKMEAALMQLANRAASGDLKAIKEFLRIDASMPPDTKDLVAPTILVRFVEAENGRPKYPERTIEGSRHLKS